MVKEFDKAVGDKRESKSPKTSPVSKKTSMKPEKRNTRSGEVLEKKIQRRHSGDDMEEPKQPAIKKKLSGNETLKKISKRRSGEELKTKPLTGENESNKKTRKRQSGGGPEQIILSEEVDEKIKKKRLGDGPQKIRKSKGVEDEIMKKNLSGVVKKDKITKRKSEGEKSFDNNSASIKKSRSSANEVNSMEHLIVEQISKETEVEQSKLTIGFISGGEMGDDFIYNLVKSKQKMVLWSENKINFKKFSNGNIEISNTPFDLIKKSEVIFWCAENVKISHEIFFSHLAFRNRLAGKYLIDLSNSDPAGAQMFHDTVREEGGFYLDARVQGSYENVKDGNVMIFTSGDKEAWNVSKHFFQTISNKTFYLGPDGGKATTLSILMSVMKATVISIISEAHQLAEGVIADDLLQKAIASRLHMTPDAVSRLVFKNSDEQSTKFPWHNIKEDLESFIFSKLGGKSPNINKVSLAVMTMNHIRHIILKERSW